jgi:conjugal transfer ATP-binding protein TraC
MAVLPQDKRTQSPNPVPPQVPLTDSKRLDEFQNSQQAGLAQAPAPVAQPRPLPSSLEGLKEVVNPKASDDEQTTQKALREFEKGVSTIRDLIAPSAIEITPDHLKLGSKFVRTLFVHTYPRYVNTNWLSPIISLDYSLDISMFIYPVKSELMLKTLKKKVGQIESSLVINKEKGNVRDPQLEAAFQDVETLRDSLQRGEEHFFRYGLYFTIYANSLKELNRATDQIDSMIGGRLIETKPAVMQMEQGFNSSLPISDDQLKVSSNMNTSPLSTTFPFVSADLTSNDGVLYGINRHNNSLVIFDRFSLENANSVVFAKSGAGKSYAVKLEILRQMMFGTDVIVIDPEHEYKYLAETVGGTFTDVSLNSETRINPFDLPEAKTVDEQEESMRSNIITLQGLLQLMLGQFTPQESSVMEKGLIETYAKKDFILGRPWPTSQQGGPEKMEYPTMQDLFEILQTLEGGKDLAERLRKYTEGTYAGILNKPTNVNIDTQLMVFSIRNLEEELRPIAMYNVLHYIWNQVKSKLKKRILVVDEAWWMMQYPDSARFLYSIAKRSRKYYLALTTITQDVADFMRSDYGQAIISNSSTQLLLKQSPAVIDQVVDTFHLTEGEKYLLLECDKGEGIFFAGLKHVAIKVVASYSEDKVITTNPEEILEREKRK